MTSTSTQASLIADIRALTAASVLAEGERETASAALSAWLTDYLKNRYVIASQRLFGLDRSAFHWQSIVKFVGHAIEEPLGARLQHYDWHEPGYDLVAVWAVPGRPGLRIAVATRRDSFEGDEAGDEGRGVLGYFELQSVPGQEDDAQGLGDSGDRRNTA